MAALFDSAFFDPAFFETGGALASDPWVYSMMRVEMQFTPGVWTTNTDVLSADTFRYTRGIAGNGPLDTVAATGTFEFSLRNDAGSSGGLGCYSPNHPNCRAGFKDGTPVRVVLTYNGIEYPDWTGTLRLIAPTPGTHGPRRTFCLAHDYMADLAEADIAVPQQIEQTDSAVLEAILDSLPLTAQPTARAIDAGLDVFPVALDDLEAATKGLSAVERVVTSAAAKLFVDGAGTLTYQTRHTIALQASQYTFSETELLADGGIAVPSDRANVFNRVRMIGHPKTFSPSPVVVATHTGTFTVAVGATEEIWLTYRDPDRADPIGATDGIQPVQLTDYSFNQQADGLGSELATPGGVIATAEFFTSTVKISIFNGSGSLAHKMLLQLRGTAIYDASPVTRESYTPMDYGIRQIDIDRPYQDDEGVLQADADYLDASYNNLRSQVLSLRFAPQRSAALMVQGFLQREIGDVVSMSETVTLPDGVTAFIQSKTVEVLQVGPGLWLTCTFGLAPRIVRDETAADEHIGISETFTPTSAAPENRIGWGAIGFMEIGA